MKLPEVHGLIRRRMLVNFRVDPEVMQRQLPPSFRPKLHHGCAIAGICLIRLEQMRPGCVPACLGASSENAAHRAAVCWRDERDGTREGVYIPRRDTDSLVNHLAGGRLFEGEYHRAQFEVTDEGERIDFAMRSDDGNVEVRLRAAAVETLPETSRFGSLTAASAFFEAGSLGYSDRSDGARLDGIELVTEFWRVEPLQVEEVYSSYFADERRFPRGSVEFDCALLMRDIPHAWRAEGEFELPRTAAGT